MPLLLECFEEIFGHYLLCWSCIENDRTILAALVSSIYSWIVDRKELKEKLKSRAQCRIIIYPYYFGVSGSFGTNLLIGRVGECAAHEAYFGTKHTGYLAQVVFLAPKATSTKVNAEYGGLSMITQTSIFS